jgi:hypothetical protein
VKSRAYDPLKSRTNIITSDIHTKTPEKLETDFVLALAEGDI